MAAVDIDRGEGSCTPAATGTPKALTTAATLCKAVEITARRSDRTDNASDVWVGFTSANDSQLKQLAPGATVSFEADENEQLDLSAIYVDAETLGDGVTFLYLN